MGIFTGQTLNSLQDLFLNQIEDLYDAEKRIVKALPKMRDAAGSPELKAAFDMHLEETRGHVERLDTIFRQMNKTPERETCEAMKGLIDEGEEMIDAKGDSAVKDAALIAAAQRIEHYEIAGYGTARAFASQLGLSNAASLLDSTLQEEGKADKKLTEIAETEVNAHALT
ncbi:MAG TPA: ferritin-like domain-containing protein [Bryobacteraceae bacterium]|nr:ferritin-like domain-containing protein [Bryobacteraceae bacterium]